MICCMLSLRPLSVLRLYDCLTHSNAGIEVEIPFFFKKELGKGGTWDLVTVTS